MLLLHCANNADLCTGWDSACKIAKTALAMYKSPKKKRQTVHDADHRSSKWFICLSVYVSAQ